ncbi:MULTISPECIES: helix-turn-helix domain-containing protein [Aquimarina]|uniref:helix-turn-helix domain-containing protein n=1 Tax=Aquimarina TaxID=290174 RepID=UPI000CDEE766|nr:MULTISPECIES: helix-turn-helix domain-containing protein [Aquimarina]
MKETFGEYIKTHRKNKGLTLTQLAALLGLDAANLSKMENEKRNFDPSKLPTLAEIFEIPFDEINDEYVSDKIGKQIYEMNCSTELLKVAEEKAAYRRASKK